MVFVVKLMHPNQLIRLNSLSHSLFVCSGRLGSRLQLSVRMRHGFAPAFVDITAEGFDLRIRAAVFLDHFVDCIQLVGVIVAAISRGHGL